MSITTPKGLATRHRQDFLLPLQENPICSPGRKGIARQKHQTE